MTHPFQFPQPTQDDLDFEKIHWIGMNPFWWKIMQGELEYMTNPDLWENYTPEIDLAIHDMMTNDLPVGFIGGKVFKTNAQSPVPNQTFGWIVFDTTEYISGMVIDGDGNLQTIEAGYYTVKASVGFVDWALGYKLLQLTKPGQVLSQASGSAEGNGNPIWIQYLPALWEGYLNAGESVQLRMLGNSGNDTEIATGDSSTWLSVRKWA